MEHLIDLDNPKRGSHLECMVARGLLMFLKYTLCMQYLNDCIKWLISSLFFSFILPWAVDHFFYRILFFPLMQFWHRYIWLPCSLTDLMNSWNKLYEVVCFPQVSTTVKYAWLKNKWSSLLRKCWCSWGTSVAMMYKSVLFGTLMRQSLRFEAVSRCVPFTKWRLPHRCGS